MEKRAEHLAAADIFGRFKPELKARVNIELRTYSPGGQKHEYPNE